jgi:hypothetical protein
MGWEVLSSYLTTGLSNRTPFASVLFQQSAKLVLKTHNSVSDRYVIHLNRSNIWAQVFVYAPKLYINNFSSQKLAPRFEAAILVNNGLPVCLRKSQSCNRHGTERGQLKYVNVINTDLCMLDSTISVHEDLRHASRKSPLENVKAVPPHIYNQPYYDLFTPVPRFSFRTRHQQPVLLTRSWTPENFPLSVQLLYVMQYAIDMPNVR